jgi:hypothetical protein
MNDFNERLPKNILVEGGAEQTLGCQYRPTCLYSPNRDDQYTEQETITDENR